MTILADMHVNKKRTGHYRYGWFLWELITDLDLKIEQLADIQEKEHYPVDCYGFYSPHKYQRTHKNGKIDYKYTWKSSTSSD